MSWINKLNETYINCQASIGMDADGDVVPLLPICHSTQKAQIEIVIDAQGNFIRARVVPREESRTIIPCTEKSGGRTSGVAPHPLCDKLQYVAGDYEQFGGSKKPYFESYLKQLRKWSSSPYSHPKVLAVFAYVSKGKVVSDLINAKILYSQPGEKLVLSWVKESGSEFPAIFGVLESQEDAFIRWIVEVRGDLEPRVWKDRELWESWIQFYSNSKYQKSLCYVNGEEDFLAEQHPAKLRNDGDKAKLISSNDSSGFTFRGRFLTADQAASVGFTTTQKAHFALRWLISRQGYKSGELTVVAWATNGLALPKPTDDPLSILGFSELSSDDQLQPITAQDVAVKLQKKIAGYYRELGDTADVVVIGLDSATPGRMAIVFYRELKGSEFLKRIDDWHGSCAWLHHYRLVPFIGAPSPHDIAEAAYGRRLDDQLKKATVARILPCIIDNQPIPRDLVESAVRRTVNRIGMKQPKDKYEREWNKTLSIACALYRKFCRKENYSMSLDPERKTRDYLYGRLLALAESLEDWALNKAGEKRETNAARLMQRFAEHPYTTWRTIELSLAPYKARLGGKSRKRQQLIDEVVASFKDEDFINDKRLSGEFLLGYHSQREYLREASIPEKESDEDDN